MRDLTRVRGKYQDTYIEASAVPRTGHAATAMTSKQLSIGFCRSVIAGRSEVESSLLRAHQPLRGFSQEGSCLAEMRMGQ